MADKQGRTIVIKRVKKADTVTTAAHGKWLTRIL